MARKTRISFNFTWIIMLIIGYNFLFDDGDKSEVEVRDQEKPAITEKAEKVKAAGKDLSAVIKETAQEFKKVAEKAVDDYQKQVKETPPEPEPEPKERQEEIVAEPEVEEPELKSLDNKPSTEEGMKKL